MIGVAKNVTGMGGKWLEENVLGTFVYVFLVLGGKEDEGV